MTNAVELLMDYVDFLLSEHRYDDGYCILQVAIRESKRD